MTEYLIQVKCQCFWIQISLESYSLMKSYDLFMLEFQC